MSAPSRASLRAGAAEEQLDLLAPQEVAVDRVRDVRTHAAVEMLRGMHGPLPPLGRLPLGHPGGVGGVAAAVEAPGGVLPGDPHGLDVDGGIRPPRSMVPWKVLRGRPN